VLEVVEVTLRGARAARRWVHMDLPIQKYLKGHNGHKGSNNIESNK
jgi:hypothetical protein